MQREKIELGGHRQECPCHMSHISRMGHMGHMRGHRQECLCHVGHMGHMRGHRQECLCHVCSYQAQNAWPLEKVAIQPRWPRGSWLKA